MRQHGKTKLENFTLEQVTLMKARHHDLFLKLDAQQVLRERTERTK
jgi:hypothetical protein